MSRSGLVRVGVLAAALCSLAWLGECSTETSSFSEDYGDCEGDTSSIANGICDAAVNTAACGYDGGDCCECTCFVGDVLCDKTVAEFSCQDPEAPTGCDLTASPTTSPTSSLGDSECTGYLPHIQDGYCDEANNNAACGFDGGDCCACTCGDDLDHPCGVDGDGFDCRDPDVPSNCSLSLPGCGGFIDNIQDSYCDYSLNNEECGYDGGDCCRCTCREFGYYGYCGLYGYDCIDPSAPLDCDTDSPTPSPSVAGYPDCEGYGFFLADGRCDSSTNNAECGWDGGDCCRCTCIPATYSCSSFNCLDPSAATDCATESPVASPYGSDDYVYYGPYPTPTTSSSDYYEDDDDTITTRATDDDECEQPVWLISDGRCDVSANTAVCGWDGGDCCECTCIDDTYACGEAGYNCLDPVEVGADCDQARTATASEEEGVEDTTRNNTSLTKAEVGGVVSLAVYGLASFGALIVGVLVYVRRKCEATAR